MKRLTLVLLAVLVLVSGTTLVGCNGGKPPTDNDMVNHIQKVWKVAATADEINQVLSFEDPQSFIPFKSEIGGILTVYSMKEDMDNGDYSNAAIKGTGHAVFKPNSIQVPYKSQLHLLQFMRYNGTAQGKGGQMMARTMVQQRWQNTEPHEGFESNSVEQIVQ